jgi:hypothetical protein
MLPLGQLQVSNQCVAICDLRAWLGPSRLDDFGGVAESILCVNDRYRDDPAKGQGRRGRVFVYPEEASLGRR